MTMKNVSLKEIIRQQYKSVVKYLPVYFTTVWKKKMYLVSEIQINAEMQQAVLNPARAQGVPELSPSWS